MGPASFKEFPFSLKQQQRIQKGGRWGGFYRLYIPHELLSISIIIALVDSLSLGYELFAFAWFWNYGLR
jgi:hypothetical protein